MQSSLAPLISFILAVALGASLFLWARIVLRLSEGQDVLPASPRYDVPWRGVHVALAFFVYLIVPGMSVVVAAWRFDLPSLSELPNDNVDVLIWRLASGSMLAVAAAALVVTYLRIDLSATLADLGCSARHAASDMGLGVRAFLAIAPPVYALQYVLVLVYQRFFDESALHPLVELVRQHPTPPMLFWSIVSAVLVAPIVEEFLFRVVLQGWLEKLAQGVRIAVNFSRENPGNVPQPPDAPARSNPYASPATTSREGPIVERTETAPRRLIAAPILITSALFAVFHLGHGPAPIPLFCLALVLGYLYQKTHRILPSLVVHMLLNGTSMLGVWFGQ